MSIWPTIRLDEEARRGSGHTPSKKYAEYWNGSIKWLSLKDTFRLDRGSICDTTSTVTEAGLANSSAVIHPSGSVVLLRDAGIGKSGVLQSDMAVSQHFVAWSCGPNLDNWYLYYLLQSRKPEFERISNGSTIKTIGLAYFRQMEIPLPDIDEQKKISEALIDIDQLIDILERLMVKKQAIKQGMMQQLLTGRTRLPGFNGDWTWHQFSDVMVRLNAKKHQILASSYSSIGLLPVVDQGQQAIIGYTNDVNAAFNPGAAGAIVFGDHTCVVKFVDFPFAVGADGTQLVTAKDSNSTRFMAYALQLDPVVSTGYNRHFKFLREKTLPIPHPIEQEAIAGVLNDVDTEIEALSHKVLKAHNVKTGMMQQLLTGRTRLPAEAA